MLSQVIFGLFLVQAHGARITGPPDASLLEANDTLFTQEALFTEEDPGKLCREKMNVVFVLDGTSSIDKRGFKHEVTLVEKIAKGFEFGNKANVGVVQFTNLARKEVDLSSDQSAFLKQASGIRQMRGGPTYIHRGLEKARHMLEASQRPKGTKARVILVSDGDAGKEAEEEVKKIEAKGGTVLSVAVGSDADRQWLMRLASSKGLFFEVSDFASLHQFIGWIVELTCDPSKHVDDLPTQPGDGWADYDGEWDDYEEATTAITTSTTPTTTSTTTTTTTTTTPTTTSTTTTTPTTTSTTTTTPTTTSTTTTTPTTTSTTTTTPTTTSTTTAMTNAPTTTSTTTTTTPATTSTTTTTTTMPTTTSTTTTTTTSTTTTTTTTSTTTTSTTATTTSTSTTTSTTTTTAPTTTSTTATTAATATTTTTTTTTTEESCSVQETHKIFRRRYDHWALLSGLGERLGLESTGLILKKFRYFNDKFTVGLYDDVSSNWTYARKLGNRLVKASDEVGFKGMRALQAEVQDFLDLKLFTYAGRGSEQRNADLESLTEDLCEGMRKYIRAAKAVEASHELYRNAGKMWNAWQEAWGPVRVYVKVTTQCRPVAPPDMSMEVFLRPNHQDEWTKCGGAEPWAPNQFPSAVMACARPDGEHTTDGDGLDRDRMVRYLGCGGNRLTKRPREPPVEQGVSEGCSQDSQEAVDWMTNLCGPGTIKDNSCRMYGPFWAIYSAPVEDLYGRKVGGTDECALSDEDSTCGQSAQMEAFKGMVNHNSMGYIYGSLPPLAMSRARAWKKRKTAISWEDSKLQWPMPEDRSLDPPMSEVLREAEVGNGITMIAYGYSGAGKTTTLIGDAGAPVGGAHGVDGVLSIYLKENSDRIKDVAMKVVEVYGRIDAGNGRLMSEEGGGLWGFNLRARSAEYVGPVSAFYGEDEKVDFQKINDILTDPKFSVNLRDIISESTSGRTDWGSEVKMKLTDIENLRMDANAFPTKSGAAGLAHIRATPNNPKSSRGTMIVMLDITFLSGEMGSVAVVDLAGAEDPAVLVEGFMSFYPADGVAECIGHEAWTPSGPSASNTKLIRKYMHEMANQEYLDTTLSKCIKLRDFLVECDRKKPKPECVDITLKSGRTEFVRPDNTKDVEYTYKEFRDKSMSLDFKFKIDGHTVIFSEDEIRDAEKEGNVGKSVAKLKAESAPYGKDECGPSESEKCPGSWAERLWGRCGLDESGKCVRIGEIDGYVLGEEMEPDMFDFAAKKYNNLKDERRAIRGIPKQIVSLSGTPKGERWRSSGTGGQLAKKWQATRKRFWRELHDWTEGYKNKEQKLTDKWDLHLQYFAKAVGPMVQESMFINEALNQMKGYLEAWSVENGKTGPGEPFDLWPVKSLKMASATAQVIDASPDSDYTRDGYDLYGFVRSSDPSYGGESYAQRTAEGHDDIMMLSLLEYQRRSAVNRGKDAKVLFGAFVRTDQPGADPDCDGARVSLEFAQQLSEAVGWKRAEALQHLR